MKRQDQETRRHRDLDKRQGIDRRGTGTSADRPSDRPEEDAPHPQDVNDMGGKREIGEP